MARDTDPGADDPKGWRPRYDLAGKGYAGDRDETAAWSQTPPAQRDEVRLEEAREDAAERPAADRQPTSPPDLGGRTVVAGLFAEREAAVAAIDDLKAAGYSPEDVGIAMRDKGQQGDLAEETGTKAAGGAATGALGGGLLGGALGLLVGLGALAIPGIGPVIAGGALATAFGLGGGTAVAGAGIGAAAGGLVGGLVGLGIPEHEAKHFEEGFNAGGVLVTVNGGARAADAQAVLRRHGADTGDGAAGGHAIAGPSPGAAPQERTRR